MYSVVAYTLPIGSAAFVAARAGRLLPVDQSYVCAMAAYEKERYGHPAAVWPISLACGARLVPLWYLFTLGLAGDGSGQKILTAGALDFAYPYLFAMIAPNVPHFGHISSRRWWHPRGAV